MQCNGNISVADSSIYNILVDDQYKHLGTMTASNASLSIEVSQRESRHSAALIPIKKTLFQRDSNPPRKLHYVDSLASTLLAVHSGAWEPLSR